MQQDRTYKKHYPLIILLIITNFLERPFLPELIALYNYLHLQHKVSIQVQQTH